MWTNLINFQDAINSASSVTQTLSGELADGQRKLLALANSKAANPTVSPLNNGPLLQEKVFLLNSGYFCWNFFSLC